MQDLLEKVSKLAQKAGDAIMEIYKSDDFKTEIKQEGGFESPLTKADKKAHKIIEDGLRQVSALPIISEEGSHEIDNKDRFWLVDPLDGTKEFIRKNGEFTVNIALIENGRPVMGAVYAPAWRVLYMGAESLGAWKVENGKKIAIKSEYENEAPTVIVSRSHRDVRTNELLKTIGKHREVSMGSSLKLCLIAEGTAQIYPRFAPTMLWDTAAADAVVRAAGGKVVDTEGNELTYEPEKSLKNPHFIACTADNILDKIRKI